jgi:surface polysaccharide O-acyltransferase-like enzyme
MGKMSKTSVKKRNPSFELLRIIAMLMILMLHYNAGTGALLQLGLPATGVNIFANTIEAFAISGINTYVLISGFFLSKSSVKISRIIKLICQVYFYTFLVSLAMMIVGTYSLHQGNSLYKLVEYLFPISSEHYWFVTAYVIMYVLAPVMNAAMDRLSRNQARIVIFGMLLWFCIIKSVVPVLFPTDRFGYDYGWFICLYLIAAYIRKYDISLFYNARKSFMVYLISSLVIAAMSISLYYVNYNRGGFAHFQEVPFNYNFFFTLTASLGLFSFFRYYNMREGRIADAVRIVGPLTFGVYLLNMHVEIRDRWVSWICGLIGEVPDYSVLLFAWHAFRTIVIVFAVGIFVDFIRKIIFDYIGRFLSQTRLAKWIEKLDEELC